MEIINMPIGEIIPYTKNPRVNNNAVDKTVMSIKEYGWQQPIVIDKHKIVIAGHTRLKAAIKMGLESCPVVIAENLTEAQAKAYRIADNRTGELATWDDDLLLDEIKELDAAGFNVSLTGFELSDFIKDEVYTKKITAPIYEPVNEKPQLSELFNMEKSNKFIDEINKSNIPSDEKLFLIEAAKRHTVFNYQKIADYYSHSNKKVQALMEKSALVIIDFKQAIENGYVRLSEQISEQYLVDYPDIDFKKAIEKQKTEDFSDDAE